MIRTLLLLGLLATVLVVSSIWMSGNEGVLTVRWLGYQVQMSIYVALTFAFIIMTLFYMLLTAMVSLWNIPEWFSEYRHARRQDKLQHYLMQGVRAMALEDHKQLQSSLKPLRKIEDGRFSRIFDAHLAQVGGKLDEARMHYTQMLTKPDQELVGLKGLMHIAMEEQLWMEAWSYSEKIFLRLPKARWLMRDRCEIARHLGKWEEVLELTKKLVKQGLVSSDKAEEDAASAYLHMAALALDKGERRQALDFARKSMKKSSASKDAVMTLAELEWRGRDRKAAIKTLKKGWEAEPHPTYIDTLCRMFVHGEEKELMKHLQSMSSPRDAGEADIACARAALQTGNVTMARECLTKALQKGETLEVLVMMIDLETQDSPTNPAIRHWLERARAIHNGPLPASMTHGLKIVE